MSRDQTNTTPTLAETYAVMMYGTKRTEVAETVALIESYYDRPWIMSESAYRRASAAAERVPRYCFERSYVEDVLGLQAPIVESGVWPRDFEKRIIQEQLLFEGFFSDILQKGKDALMSTVDGVKQFGKEAWSVLKGFYLAVREGKTEALFRAIAQDVIKGIYMPLKKGLTYLAEKLPNWKMPTFGAAAQKALDLLKSLKDKMMSAKGWQKIAMASGVAIGLTWLWEKIGDWFEELAGETDGLTLSEADGDSKIAQVKAMIKDGGPGIFKAIVGSNFKEIVEKIAMASSIGPWWEAAKSVGKGAAIVTAAIGGATAKFVDDHEQQEKLSKATGEAPRERAEKDKQNESYNRGTMKITKRQLRRIIQEALPDVSMYDLGREDSLAGTRPQLPDGDYMMGYNEAQADAGLPTMQPPSDSGRGKKLDPSKLKGALAGKHYGKRH